MTVASVQDSPPAPLETSAIRARRRPGAMIAFWGLRLLAAWILAAPLAGALGGTGVGRFPQGDALLFAPGGTYLMEAIRLGIGTLVAELQNTAWFALILGYLGLVPLAGLLYALCHGGRLRPGDVARRALGELGPFTLLAGLTLLVQAGVVVLGVLLLWALRASIYGTLDARRADLWLLGATGVVVLAVLFVGVVQDLARAALTRHRQGLKSAIATAVGTARRRPLSALLTWLVPALWSIALVALGAPAVGWLHVEHSGSGRVLGVLAVHQLIALGLVALKAQWLCGALRLVGEAEDPEAQAAAVAPSV